MSRNLIGKQKDTEVTKPLTRTFLITRGYCCGMKCQNCPYTPKHTQGATEIVILERRKKE